MIVLPIVITLVVILAIVVCIFACKKRNKIVTNYEELECLSNKSRIGIEPLTERIEDSC